MWFENGTEKARKLKKENSKRLIKSAILGNADNYCHIFIFICGDILKKPDAEILGVPGGHVGFIVRSDYYIDLIEKFLNKIAI